MSMMKSTIYLSLVLLIAHCSVVSAWAQDACSTNGKAVLSGDPCEAVSGVYPMIPELPLVLPNDGVKGSWSSGLAPIDQQTVGDVDVVVRAGDLRGINEIPAPSGLAGSPLQVYVAGGGTIAQGSEVPYSLMITDGPGTLPYGTVLADPAMDQRPCAVYAFADLDGDGFIGPTDSDGSIDNGVEAQEVTAHVGRQVGPLTAGRFDSSLGIQVAAPASLGGLVVKLSGGAYTGDDAAVVWSEGTPVFTKWPFFPPLDPGSVIRMDDPNPPNPEGRNMIKFQPTDFFLPDPGDPVLGGAFSLLTDGSDPTTDQVLVVSGPVVGARLFQEIDLSNFQAQTRVLIRPAPAATGGGRVLVTPADALSFAGQTAMALRLLPVDLLGNVADPGLQSLVTVVTATDGLRILSPDTDGDPSSETITLSDAAGASIVLDASSAGVQAQLWVAETGTIAAAAVVSGSPSRTREHRVLRQSAVSSSDNRDSDGDGVPDDGDSSGISGDRPCTPEHLAKGWPCDDNCRLVVNPGQFDSDASGDGNCCDGTCVLDSDTEGCFECPQLRSRYRGAISRARVVMMEARAGASDRIRVKRVVFSLATAQRIRPDAEEVQVGIMHSDGAYYWASLPAVLVGTGDNKNYEYRDSEGRLRGVRAARLGAVNGSAYFARLRARGPALLDWGGTDHPSGVVLHIAVGDDAFTGFLSCKTGRRATRCRVY